MIRSDQKMINQYFKFIQDSGYKYWKDPLGFYFERGIKRFSIIQIGPFLDVYYNKKIDGKYTLQEKLTGKIMLLECLIWIFERSKTDIFDETSTKEKTVMINDPFKTNFSSNNSFKKG